MTFKVRPLLGSDMMATHPPLYRTDGKLYTKNLVPGTKVYGEKLVTFDNVEYRSWNPYRSKLAAAVLNGHLHPVLTTTARILYLGAANGTTVSHLSDIAANGTIYALDISPRAMQDLLKVSTHRHNIIPILGDANKTDDYKALIGEIDLVYQDIAQRNQIQVFIKNMIAFHSRNGILMVKARSIDVTQNPQKIYATAKKCVSDTLGTIKDAIPLHPYEKDHLAIYI